jgi:hypothetical protein
MSWTVGSLVLPSALMISCSRAATMSAINVHLAISSELFVQLFFSGYECIYEMSLGSPVSDLFSVLSLVQLAGAALCRDQDTCCDARIRDMEG